MSIRPLIATYLLILCVGITGCGTPAEPKADTESVTEELTARKKRIEREEAAKKAEEEERAARQKDKENRQKDEEKRIAEKKAAEKKAAEAAANSYVKVKVEVELRGVLTCTDEAVTVSIVSPEFGTDRFNEVKWVLDFGEEKEVRAKARSLEGKTVSVTGSAILRGIKSETRKSYERIRNEGGLIRPSTGRATVQDLKLATKSVLDLEPKVAVKSFVAAPK
jgi:hypothetical protein